MISPETAARFAKEWIAAWNSHDLERILSHYTTDFEMSSPFIAKVTGNSSGTLKGKAAVGDYWRKALQQFPDLRFELIDTLWSVDSICIYYRSVLGLRTVEWLWLDEHGKARKAIAHYNRA